MKQSSTEFDFSAAGNRKKWLAAAGLLVKDREAAALKAVDLDPTLAETHAALGATQFWNKRETDKAQASFNRALELNSNSAIIHHTYAWFLTATARFDEAERHLRRALELDPLSPSINVDQGLPLFFARRFAEARASYGQALKSNANFWYGHLRLAEACEGAGDYTCATSEFKRAAELFNDEPMIKAQLARTLALADKKDEARRLLKELNAENAPRNSPYYLALAFSALDETDKAFENLNRAVGDQDKWLGWAAVDPRLDSLHNDKRFGDFLKRAK
ncbi:MAG: tetratricopeptide repeat protein [Pyrinomonadaceae bacterium]